MNYASNGQYVLERLILNSEDTGNTINLIPAMVEVDLFESINESSVSGMISIVDTMNLADILPLYGNETIEICFYTAGNENNPVEYTGRVYKISERHRITEHSMGYTIMFCSEEQIKSERMFVQSGYENTIDNIARDILGNKLGSSKEFNVEKTKGIMKYVLGSIHPIQAIGMISKNAIGSNDNTGYIFYEDLNKFNFVSLQSLYQQEPITEYTYRNAGYYEDVKNRAAEQFNSIQEIKILEENSLLDRVMDGLHGSKHMYFDLLSKKPTVVDYSKSEYYEKSKSLGALADKKEVDSGDDVLFMNYNNNVQDIAQTRTLNKMRKLESETFKTEITVFGDSTIRAGMVVYVTIPNWNSDQLNIRSVYSGNMLIGSIRHTITQKHYAQSIMLQKESYEDNI